MAKTRSYYFGLDVIRFAAACMVMFYHLSFFSWAGRVSAGSALPAWMPTYPELIPISWFGWTGVEIFFVISGFVIANSVARHTPGEFIWGRILRLYPAVWICATITLLVAWPQVSGSAGHINLVQRYIHSLVLFPNSDWPVGWVDGVYWTLSIELSFYIFAFVATLIDGLRTLIALTWAMTIYSTIYLGVIYLKFIQIPWADAVGNFTEQHNYLVNNLLLIRYGSVFAVGIWLWVLAEKNMTPSRYVALAIAIAGTMTETYLRSKDFILSIKIISDQPSLSAVSAVACGIVAIYICSRNASQPSKLPACAQRFMRHLGLMTYPLYLLHFGLCLYIMRLIGQLQSNRWISLVVPVVISLALTWLIANRIEPRARKFLSLLPFKIGAALWGERHI